MVFRSFAHAIKHDAGLYFREPPRWIKRLNGAHVLGEIEHDGRIAALTRKACAGAAGEDGSAELSTGADCCLDVTCVAGNDDSDGHLAIIGGIGCIETTGSLLEADFSADGAFQASL